MQRKMPLPVAKAQLEQSMRDFLESYDDALLVKPIDVNLCAGIILMSLRDLERTGWTEGGRRSLKTAIEATKSILGV